ncbi:MAG: tight adherence protein C [Planctomycetota bacterium]|jgi:tight adherence protein C
MLKTIVIVIAWLIGVGILYYLFTRSANARRSRERMGSTIGEDALDSIPERQESFLALWLIRAGFRRPGSPSAFILATVVGTGVGIVLALLVSFSGVSEFLQEQADLLAGSVGAMVSIALTLLPWCLILFSGLAPLIYVRGKRRDRVDYIERELPVVLELLATLSESGLGFDASFAKILDSDREETPLIAEFRIFRLETLSGIARIRCFRRLSHRCNISSMTIFCSALIQAEQIGTGFSSVLRIQATDLRGRRRDRAMIKAQALPVKLVFPLVICFLPGIFVVTLGPAFKEFFDLAQGVMGGP